MATKKITITLPEETLARLKEEASTAGLPLSTYIAQVTEHHARIQGGLAALREWETVSGPVDAEDEAWADREIARLDGLTRATPSHAAGADRPAIDELAS